MENNIQEVIKRLENCTITAIEVREDSEGRVRIYVDAVRHSRLCSVESNHVVQPPKLTLGECKEGQIVRIGGEYYKLGAPLPDQHFIDALQLGGRLPKHTPGCYEDCRRILTQLYKNVIVDEVYNSEK